MTGKIPSAFQIEKALSLWNAAKSEVLDEELDGDTRTLVELLGGDYQDPSTLLRQVIRGAIYNDDMASMCEQWIDRGTERLKRFQARRDRLRKVAEQLSEVLGEPKINEHDFDTGFSAGREFVHVTDIDALPSEYKVTTANVAPDKRKIAADIKQGVVIEGATLSNAPPVFFIRKK